MSKQLNQAVIGEYVTITSLHITNPKLEKRLLSLGCKEGCEICIKQKGLFGGPCTFETKGQYISIRNCDACDIMVEVR
ncbi:ferrous iron transport protein A [Listeria grandensis]|uniref:Ferrous iron transport protein A n=1 Tax=Listeria grandensis TaxID=1494963 RepID=A0A7X1CPN1_9LIST|nr:ferrous iron transport protein A [Listeria grandensis]MBC1475586.1 ferrous iron transport protein A [Listeria grandensis]MBC1936175.1 ferrous iron transport protein A [Listeria grandensis]